MLGSIAGTYSKMIQVTEIMLRNHAVASPRKMKLT